MCGRFASSASTADLAFEFDIEEVVGADLAPSWNIAPTDPVRMVVKRRPSGSAGDVPPVRQLRTARWGLVPSWAKDRKGGARLINARIETVTTKPAFSSAAGRRRCLLPALGYYEWRKADGSLVPYFLHDPEGRLLMFAGLYEIWRDPALPADHPDARLWTCTIITRAATDRLSHIHDRSPVIVPAGLHEDWLDCSRDEAGTVRLLLDGIPESHLEPHVVSAAVNSVRNNGPALIEPVGIAGSCWQLRLELGER